jgi:molybdate-binding protein/DNA-binding XRE family transcriptional regulator
MAVKSNIREFRKKAGLTQDELARSVGVSRQAFSAVESGRSVPSTELALRLARLLGASVEDIFALDDEAQRVVKADLIGQNTVVTPGSPVQLVQVGTRLLARSLRHEASLSHAFSPADALVKSSRGSHVDLTVLNEAALKAPALVLAGCDPATTILSHAMRDAGVRFIWIEEESMPALHSLARGEVHAAGCNFKDPASGLYNAPLVREIVPFPCAIIRFAVWRHGIMVREGNPKSITEIDDLARGDVTLINRHPGAGSRGLLNRLLKESHIPADLVRGYDKQVNGHLAAAETIAAGLVDCGIGIEAAARANDLGFMPLNEEPYDLVIPRHFLELPSVKLLLDVLNTSMLRLQVGALGGYDTSSMGRPAG